GRNLANDLGSKEAVVAVVKDFRTAGLSDRDVAMLSYAQKVARRPHEISQADIDTLREHEFSEPQIADIALCASIRCFIARYFEATGAGPEAKFIDEDPPVRDTFAVGRALR